MSYKIKWVKLFQSSKCRRTKYRVMKSLGFSALEARKFRDYRLKELIKLARNYLDSIGYNPQDASDLLTQEIAHLEDSQLSLQK